MERIHDSTLVPCDIQFEPCDTMCYSTLDKNEGLRYDNHMLCDTLPNHT